MRPREVYRQGHRQNDLEKVLPAERVEDRLSTCLLANARVSFSHIWFHIWNQPDARFKVLMRLALTAPGRRPCGDTVPRPCHLLQMVARFLAVLLWAHSLCCKAGEGSG